MSFRTPFTLVLRKASSVYAGQMLQLRSFTALGEEIVTKWKVLESRPSTSGEFADHWATHNLPAGWAFDFGDGYKMLLDGSDLVTVCLPVDVP